MLTCSRNQNWLKSKQFAYCVKLYIVWIDFMFVLHAWFNPRRNILPSSCHMYVKVKASIWWRKDVLVTWCSGYHVCGTYMQMVLGSILEGAFPLFCNMYVKLEASIRKDVLVPWCSGYHVCFTRRRSRVRSPREPFAIFLSHNSLHWCAGSPAGVVVIASALHAESDQEKCVGSLV